MTAQVFKVKCELYVRFQVNQSHLNLGPNQHIGHAPKGNTVNEPMCMYV